MLPCLIDTGVLGSETIPFWANHETNLLNTEVFLDF